MDSTHLELTGCESEEKAIQEPAPSGDPATAQECCPLCCVTQRGDRPVSPPAFTGTSDPWLRVQSPYLQIKAEMAVKREREGWEPPRSSCHSVGAGPLEPRCYNLAWGKREGSQLGPWPMLPHTPSLPVLRSGDTYSRQEVRARREGTAP